jgi:hypothetical protein
MPFANYNDLLAGLSNWLDHTLYAPRYPDFIVLFEATANRRLKTRQQETTIILVPSNPQPIAVTGAANNGVGLIRLTVADATGFNTNDLATVTNVQGTVEANGTWQVNVIDNAHVDLQNSTFAHPFIGASGTIRGMVGWVDMPVNFTAWRRLTYTGSPRTELSYVHPSYFQAAYPSFPADIPRIFTIEGDTIKIMPTSSTPLEFDYWAGISPLTAVNPVNQLMTLYPDVYLFGCLCEAEAFGVNDERMPMWKARRDEIFNEIELVDMQRHAPSYIRVFGVTP